MQDGSLIPLYQNWKVSFKITGFLKWASLFNIVQTFSYNRARAWAFPQDQCQSDLSFPKSVLMFVLDHCSVATPVDLKAVELR